MTRRVAVIALVPVLALSACTAGPRLALPTGSAIHPAPAWRSPSSQGTVNASWWQNFDDPALSLVVQAALANNPDIEIAADRVIEARADLRVADSASRPLLSLVAIGAHMRDINAFGKDVTQDVGRGQLALSYDTDLFGRAAAVRGAARAALLATEDARANVQLAIAATAATAYINLRASDAKLVVLTDTLTDRAEALKLARKRVDRGYTGNLEAEQAEAEFHATEQAIPQTRLAIRRQEDALLVLLGQSAGTIERGKTITEIDAPTPPAGLPSQLLRRRPDIAQAEQILAASDKGLDAARAAFLPTVQISITSGSADSSLIPNPVAVFSQGGSILAPLLSGGRLKAQAMGAAARRDEAAFGYQKTVLNAFREVEDGLAAETDLKTQEDALSLQRAAVARALTLAKERYAAGYSAYLEQLDAQRLLLAVDFAFIQARADRLNAAVTLFQALGGGWVPEPQKPSAS